MINYGELYYNHYCKFLNEPIDRKVYTIDDNYPSIQILEYNNVFENCVVYNTFGLSNYDYIMGKKIEISLVCDNQFDKISNILANCLYYCIDNNIALDCGKAIHGINNIDAKFVNITDKNAIYFTEPYAFPSEYQYIKNKLGEVLLAIFISDKEYLYLQEYGFVEFEDILEKSNVDPFEINRKSIL